MPRSSFGRLWSRFFLQLMTAYKEGFLNGVPKESGFELVRKSLNTPHGDREYPFPQCELGEKPKTDGFVFALARKQLSIRLESE